jgi:hypothetical protein
MLVASARVFFMMSGLALFYGGLVGDKNVIGTMAHAEEGTSPPLFPDTLAHSTLSPEIGA